MRADSSPSPKASMYSDSFMRQTIANANDLCNSNRQFTVCYMPAENRRMNADSTELADLPDPIDPVRAARLAALRRMVEAADGPASFARQHPGVDPTYVSQLLNGHRAFGDRAARNMESRIGLPAGSLDSLTDPPEPSNVAPGPEHPPAVRALIQAVTSAPALSDADVQLLTDMAQRMRRVQLPPMESRQFQPPLPRHHKDKA